MLDDAGLGVDAAAEEEVPGDENEHNGEEKTDEDERMAGSPPGRALENDEVGRGAQQEIDGLGVLSGATSMRQIRGNA